MTSTTRYVSRRDALIGAAALIAAGRARAQRPAPVKIAAIVPLSGPWARRGQVKLIGAQMAVEHVNRAGGIEALGGAPLELVVFDAGDSVERAKNAAQRMVAEHPDLAGAVGSSEFGLGRGRLPTVSNGSAMGDPDLAANMSKELLDGVMSTVGNWHTRGLDELQREFVARSGEPWLTQNPLCAYGHVWILKEALERAGSADRHAVADAIRALDLTDGPARYFPGGRVRFDSHGRRIDTELLVIQWQNGVPLTVYPPDAAVAEPVWPKA